MRRGAACSASLNITQSALNAKVWDAPTFMRPDVTLRVFSQPESHAVGPQRKTNETLNIHAAWIAALRVCSPA
jgi:hypothetical protein